MLKRWFGKGNEEKKPGPAPSAEQPAAWNVPEGPWLDYFNLHLRGVTLEEAEQALVGNYLLHGDSGAPGMVLRQQGHWVTAYLPREIVSGVGFNRQASQVARERDTWVIGYRIFAGEGGDVHYFNGAEHVEQLAFTSEGIEFEPDSPAPFAALADASGVIPRPPTQHPLDFHFALLDALGVSEAALTWTEVVERHEVGALGESKLVLVP
jgi:hypothetical protein